MRKLVPLLLVLVSCSPTPQQVRTKVANLRQLAEKAQKVQVIGTPVPGLDKCLAGTAVAGRRCQAVNDAWSREEDADGATCIKESNDVIAMCAAAGVRLSR